MRSNLCRLLLAPALAAAAVLFCHPAKAETVSVPFSFSAAGKSFPAGTYSVQSNINATLVTLSPANNGRSVQFTLEPGDAAPTDSRVVLRFRMSGDEHVLDSIVYRGKVTAHLGGSHGKTRYADRDQNSQPPAGE